MAMFKEKALGNTICIYRANCADGFGAAFAVWVRFGGANITYHAASYGETPPDVKGKHVIMVDFSYKRDVLEAMIQDAATLVVLDHHKTAQADLAFLPTAPAKYKPLMWGARDDSATDLPTHSAIFDMGRSGAVIAWEYFHPDMPVPMLLRHIQDRDLWLFRLPYTKEINAALWSEDFTFGAWMAYALHWEETSAALRTDGAAIMRNTTRTIQGLIDNQSFEVEFYGRKVLALNCTYNYASEAGHIMAVGRPFSVSYMDTPTGRKYSLRSSGGEGSMDVSAIASTFGGGDGGGHPNAAGFTTDGADHPWYLITPPVLSLEEEMDAIAAAEDG